MKESEFIRLVHDDIAERNITLRFGRGKQVNAHGVRADGYFSEQEKVLAVARRSSQWLGVLVHEYAHYRQWVEGYDYYIKSDSALVTIDKWFAGEDYAERKLSNAFQIVRTMERDAEQRTAEMIQRYSLPVDLNLYIKRANCYIYAHFIMQQKRKFWAFKKNPFLSRTVLALMRSDFRARAHESLPRDIEAALVSLI